MEEKILEALRKIDAANDNHWTADGQPRLDTVKMLAGNPAITRELVDAAAPGFTRVTAATYTPPAAQAQQASDPVPVGAGSGATVAPAAPEAMEQGEGDSGATFSPQVAEQPEVDELAADPADEIQTLAEELEEADARVEEIRAIMVKVTDELNARVAHADAVRLKYEAAQPANSNALAVQDYFASVDATAAARAGRRRILVESGLDLKELTRSLSAPIDTAMARRTSRGTKRPTVI
jgi:hypothetical protein